MGAGRMVVVVSTLFRTAGGIQRFNRLLCRALDELAPELGLECTVLSLEDRLEDYEEQGRPWQNLRFLPGRSPATLALRTLALCLRQRPRMLLIGHLGMTPLGPLCRPAVRSGFAFVAYGTEAWEVPQLSRRWSARRARRVFAISELTGRKLVEATDLDASRLRLLPPCLEPELERFEPVDESGGRGELLAVGRLAAGEGRKGLDTTLQALARLAPRFPDLTLRIVGGGPGLERLTRLAERLGIAERVIFEQGLTDAQLAERYRRCTAFVLPSGQEGFGIVFVEAMWFGKPCIGGRVGGTPEVIADGETGYLVPYGDIDALTAAIERLLSDPALRGRMGSNAHRHVLERFSYGGFRHRLRRHLVDWMGSS